MTTRDTASAPTMRLTDALDLVREIPDFPRPGVRFRDVNPVIADPVAFTRVVGALADSLPSGTELIAAVEARGFLFAAALGYATGLGVVPVRKPGRLPVVAHRAEYTLEYGSAVLELPVDGVDPGQSVAVVDDVLATGGTAAAAAELIGRAGGVVSGAVMLLELAGLGGRQRLAGVDVRTLRTV